MAYTAEQLNHLRAAVKCKMQCWDAQRAFEKSIGADVDGMEDMIEDLASSFNDPAEVDAKVTDEILEKGLTELETFPFRKQKTVKP